MLTTTGQSDRAAIRLVHPLIPAREGSRGAGVFSGVHKVKGQKPSGQTLISAPEGNLELCFSVDFEHKHPNMTCAKIRRRCIQCRGVMGNMLLPVEKPYSEQPWLRCRLDPFTLSPKPDLNSSAMQLIELSLIILSISVQTG